MIIAETRQELEISSNAEFHQFSTGITLFRDDDILTAQINASFKW